MSGTLLSSYLLKVTHRCNFSCDHCYDRKKADQSYLKRPPDMGLDTLERFSSCLGQYAYDFNLPEIQILFHGGEPLLRGTPFFERAVETILKHVPPTTKCSFSLQTNASLLSLETIRAFQRLHISISVSLDGNNDAQDRHRRFKGGESSFETVARNLRSFQDPELKSTLGGILAVVDIENDPIETFDFLSELSDSVDFLWPDGNHVYPPPGISDESFQFNSVYADWLIPIFDKWFNRGIRKPAIRFFENILRLLLGGESDVEGIGQQSLSLLTIETDGEIRDSDVMSVAYEHAARFGNGMYLGDRCFQHLSESTVFMDRQHLYSFEAMSPTCKECSYREICGGGLLPHRFGKDQSFSNPSIYCSNLIKLISHIEHTLKEHITKAELQPVQTILPNHMEKVAEFIHLWDFSSSESAGYSFPPIYGPQGSISRTGRLDQPVGIALTPADPNFPEHIEEGVRDLVLTLVYDLNCITYSSCQGHRVSDSELRPRNVGILCRDEIEQDSLHQLLRSKAPDYGDPSIFRDLLESDSQTWPTVEIVFDYDPVHLDEYWGSLENRYQKFLSSMKSAVRPLPPDLDLNLYGVSKDSDHLAEDLKDLIGDLKFTHINSLNSGIRLKNCDPFYPNEFLSVIHQSRSGNICTVRNHAWALMFWQLKLDSLLNDSPERGIHIIHIDYHSDLASPRLIVDGSGLTNFFTGKRVSLSNPEQISEAIYSSAIGPGNFIIPFLHAHKNRSRTMEIVVPALPSYDGDHFSNKDWRTETGSSNIPGISGHTINLVPDSGREAHSLRIYCNEISDSSIQPDFENDFVLLDIDLDFFSNQLKGSSDWQRDPGWNPDARTLEELFGSLKDLMNKVTVNGFPHLVTISLSPDFCPSHIQSRALDVVHNALHLSGLEEMIT